MPFAPVSHLEIILAIFAFVSITYIGLAVYLKKMNSWTNRFFSLLALVLDVYVVVNMLSLHPPGGTPSSQLFWIKGDIIIGSLISLLLFLLVHTFPRDKIQLAKKYVIGLVVFTALNIALIAGGLVFSAMSYPHGTPVPVVGPFVALYGIDFVGIILLSCILLLRKYIRSVGVEKIRLLYFLMGVISTFCLLALFTLINAVVFKSASGIFLGPIFPVLLMLAVGYSIIKYRFLDIQPIIARAVSYTLLVVLLALAYSGILFYGFNTLFGVTFNLRSIALSVIVTTVIALTFQPLHTLIRRVTDRFFFKDLYDAEKILSDLSRVIAHNINFDDLSEKLLTTITKELRVTKSAVLLVADGALTEARSIGYQSDALLTNAQLAGFLQSLFSVDKLFLTSADIYKEGQETLFHALDIEAIVPVRADNKPVAFILLGPKLSGVPYSTQDLNLLNVFAADAGAAIKNARLYSELKLALDAKSRFITVVSHQLRTPISGIRWGLETLREEGVTPKQEGLLNNSYEKVIFLADQLDDILISLDIIDSGISVTKSSCNILDMCKEIVREFAPTIESSNIQIAYSMNETVSTIEADYSKLKKILKVIIKNAIVYSHSGGTVRVTSMIEPGEYASNIVIAVEDDGLGIAEQQQQHIFEEFFRGDNAKSTLPNGLGLGLYISKTFAHVQGGDIRFESKGKDKGAIFSIILPIK